MNPLQWGDALRGLQEHLDPSDGDVSNSMRNTSRSYNGCDTYCQYSRYPADEAHNRSGVNAAEEMNDMELARKGEELREIQQKIILKKASIALKALEPGLSSHADTSNGESLRDRVNFILQQRKSLSIWPKVLSPKRRMNSSKDDLILEDHPLKLRVKALMKQRFSGPHVLPPNTEVPEVTPPPPSQRVTSPAKEETRDMGFQRFLSVLNKGVDIDLLSRIVNEDGENLALGEEIFSIQTSAVEDKSDMGESRGSHSRDSLPGCSGTDDGARRTSLPSREKSLNNSPPLRGDEEKKKYDKGDGSLCSGRGSQSPPAVKKKKKEEEPPKVDEQHEQLQNILKTLGLSLEVEEMSKLADRTQERLYGKKPEGRVDADSRVEQESPQRASDRHCRSSSSSSSSSSRSTERNYIPSLSRQYPSNTWCTERKTVSECSNSGDGNQDSQEAQRPRDIDINEDEARGEDSSYLYQYYQEQVYCNAHPASLSEFSDYTLPQGSRYTDYDGATTNSYSTYTQGVVPPPLDVSGYPYPPVTDHYFPGSVVAPNIVNSLHNRQISKSAFKDINLLVNPDLSTSEGQAGSAGERCLQVINTGNTGNSKMRPRWIKLQDPAAKRTARNLARARRRRRKRNLKNSQPNEEKSLPPEEAKRLPPEEKEKRLPLEEKEKRLPPEEKEKRLPPKEKEKRLPPEVEEKRLPPKVEEKRLLPEVEEKRLLPEVEEKRLTPEVEEKRLTPEEEIKVNLRKKLEAFNQKMRRQVTQPAISRTPHNESVDYQDLT